MSISHTGRSGDDHEEPKIPRSIGTAFRLHLPVRAAADRAPSPTPAAQGEMAGAGSEPALSEEGIALG